MQDKHSLASALAMLALLAGCSSTAPQQQPENTKAAPVYTGTQLVALDDFPDWFVEALANDVAIETRSSLVIESLGVDHQVLGNIALQDSDEDFLYYHVDIGTETPVECFVTTDYQGHANGFYDTINMTFDGIATHYEQPLSGRFNFAVDVGVVAGAPYLAHETMYTVGAGESAATGLLKAMSVEIGRSLQVCLHNEMGYRQAFRQVFESFVEGFAAADTSNAFFWSLYRIGFNGVPVGYGLDRYTQDSEGDVYAHVVTAFMMMAGDTAVVRSDSVGGSWSKTDGSLINGSEYNVENGAVVSEFAIGYKNKRWEVEGVMQGKPINAVLPHEGWILSQYGSYTETIDILNGDDSRGEYAMWTPVADPTNVLTVVFRELDDDPNANFEMDLGAMIMRADVDADGITRSGTMQQGPVTMSMELLDVQGKPALP